MSEFQKKADGIFARFAEKLSKVDLKLAVCVPAVIGAATVIAGCALESHGQLGLIKDGGIAALDAYKGALAQMQLPLGEFIRRGVEGKLTSFGGDTQARGFALMAAGPMLSAAAVTLSRGFTKLKQKLVERGEQLRETAHQSLRVSEQPDDVGRYNWAQARASEAVEGSWREPRREKHEIPERIGTVEMLQRLALEHRLRSDHLVMENGEVRVHGDGAARPLCKVGSPFWSDVERNTLVLHRYAQKHQLDASDLYIREGAVYEQNKEAFSDRTVCKTDSTDWAEAYREQLSAELDRLFGADAPAEALRADAASQNEEQAPRARFRPA